MLDNSSNKVENSVWIVIGISLDPRFHEVGAFAIQENFESKLGYKRGIGVKEQLIKKILDVGKRAFERLTRKCHVDDHA
jgi:hypothetical protein